MIGQKHQPPSLGIAIADTAQPRRVALLGVEYDEFDFLVAEQSRAAVHRVRIHALESEVGFGAGDKEAAGLIEAVEPFEVEVAAIHHVESARFGKEHVEDVDLVQFAVGDVDEAGNSAAQVEQRVQLHGRFGRAKLGPRKQRQAQVDSGGIQGIDRFGEIDRKRFLGIQTARGADKGVGKLGVDAPVARLVGVGQRAAAHRATQSHVIELGRLRVQTRFDIAQAFAIGQLREGHREKLVQAAERADVEIAAVLRHQTAKGMPRRELHEL